MNKNSEETLKNFAIASEAENATLTQKANTVNNDISHGNMLGWIKLPLTDLPTKGNYYYDGTEILIKSATGGEIRHWSTINEDDISGVDDMLNYILERCCKVVCPAINNPNWKDIIELDRFYIILAIRELTFKGENPLQVPIGSNKTRPVTKEMITFVEFSEKIMKYYNKDTKCFTFKFKNGKELFITLPTLGTSSWLKQYVIKNQQKGIEVDSTFLTYAPFIMDDWRNLSDKSFEDMLTDSHGWDIQTISLMSKIIELLSSIIKPEISYIDEHGMEVRAPLEFLGGIKSMFIIQDIFDELL